MKIYRRILAGALSAAIISAPVQTLSARAEISVSGPGISAEETPISAVYATKESAAEELRKHLRNRETEFTMTVSASVIGSKDDMTDIISRSLEDTGDPCEGDYLRWNIKYYSYSTLTDRRTGTVAVTFSNTYNSTAAQEAQVDKAVDRIMAELDLAGKSNYEKISAVYSYTAKNVTYNETSEAREVFSAYGAIVQHSAVCQGYALMLYRLLSEADVPCRVITGTANGGNHAWNIAEAGGKFYYLDVTWDSTLGSSKLYYFMRGTKDFDSLMPSYSHTAEAWDANSPLYADYSSADFSRRYPMSETAYNSADSIAYQIGDPDGDGIVDSADSTLILESYAAVSVGKRSGLLEPAKRASDVNSDGAVDSSDASAILSYYAYISTGAFVSFADFIKTL